MPKTTLKSLNNQQNFLRILIFSVVTIMIWIGFTIFRTQQTTQISPELQQMALPLTPTISLDVIDRIDQKKTYTDQELSSFPIYALQTDSSGAQSISPLKTGAQTQASGGLQTLLASPAPSPEATAEPTPSQTTETTPAEGTPAASEIPVTPQAPGNSQAITQ